MTVTKDRSYFFQIAFLTIGLLLNLLAANAQDTTQSLPLREAIRMALDQNRQISLAKADEKIALSLFKQTEAIWLPQVNLSYTGFITNQPLSAFGFKLQQAQVQAADFNPATLNHPGAVSNFMTQLSVQQPLFNPEQNYLRKAAWQQSEVFAHKTQRTKEAITTQVTSLYLQLDFAYETVKLWKETLATIQAIYRFTNNRYQQGLLQKSDLLLVEVQEKNTETNLAEANSQIKNISDQLGLFMNNRSGIIYTTTTTEEPESILPDSVPAARSDMKAMATAVSAYELAIKATQKTRLPKINAFANYQLNDTKIAGFGANAYLASIQVSWDLFNGHQSKNKITTQTLEKNKLQEQIQEQLEQGSLEIRKTKRQLADSQFRIQQQLTAVMQAEEALRILQNRYSQGLVNTTDVLLAQTQVSQQKMLLAQAVFMQKNLRSYLQFLTTAN